MGGSRLNSCADRKFSHELGGVALEVRRPFILRQMLKPF